MSSRVCWSRYRPWQGRGPSMYHQPWWGLPRVLGSDEEGTLSVADNELHRSRVYSWMDSSHVLINYGPFLSLQSVPHALPWLLLIMFVLSRARETSALTFPSVDTIIYNFLSRECTLHLASFSESPAEVCAFSFWAALHFMSPLTSVYLLLGRVVFSFAPLCKSFWECSCKKSFSGCIFLVLQGTELTKDMSMFTSRTDE